MMKKAINLLSIFSMALILCVGLFGFVGCDFSASYSADSIKNNLVRAGFTVSEGDLIFDDDVKASELAGIQKVYLVTKGADADKEAAFFLVFNSIGNAENGVTDQRLPDIADSAQSLCGANKKGEVGVGRYNNVVFAGLPNCRTAAGIQ